MSNTNTYGDQLIETLLNAANELHDETGVPMPVIADAMYLGCGIPHSIFGAAEPETASRPEQHETDVPPIRTLGLIGAGTMSQGIARAAIHAGIDVCIAARDPERATAASDAVLRDVASATAHLASSPHLETLASADIIVEAISEDLAGKQQVLSEVERAVPEAIVLATTTSSLAIDDIASALADPRRLVGMHFFNPADRNRLVELVGGPAPQSHQRRARQLATQLNKHLVEVPGTPGFIVNRVLIPYLNAVFDLMDRGAPLREIDLDIRRRYRLPVGPARLAGIIGSDVVLAIQTSLHRRLERADLRPARALQALVDRGVLGNKSGHMFPAALNDGA